MNPAAQVTKNALYRQTKITGTLLAGLNDYAQQNKKYFPADVVTKLAKLVDMWNNPEDDPMYAVVLKQLHDEINQKMTRKGNPVQLEEWRKYHAQYKAFLTAFNLYYKTIT